MRFSYSVIGDNTQENREWLEKVGYKFTLDNIDILDIIITSKSGFAYLLAKEHLDNNDVKERIKESINCIGNSPLFKAVSAMREDSDFGQLFECKDGLFICQYETSREHIDKECKGWDITNLKKFNLVELQERFKEKEK